MCHYAQLFPIILDCSDTEMLKVSDESVMTRKRVALKQDVTNYSNYPKYINISIVVNVLIFLIAG